MTLKVVRAVVANRYVEFQIWRVIGPKLLLLTMSDFEGL